jgi:hypothetical protein
MKKVIFIGFALSLLSTSAFAATDFDSAGGAGTGVLTGFKASKQVIVTCNSVAQTYAAAADHMNGTRVYGTASGDPLIYFMEKTTTQIGDNVADDELSTTSDSTAFIGVAGWSSL